MALKTVTGKVSGASNTALSAPTVWISLSQSAVITGTQEVLNSPIPVSVASDGTYSVQLQANGDLTPSTTYYTATEAVATGTVPQYVTSQLTFVVPQTAGPFVMSLIATPPPALGPAWDATLVHLAGAETLTGVKSVTVLDWGGIVYNIKSKLSSTPALLDGSNDQPAFLPAFTGGAKAVVVPSGTASIGGAISGLYNTVKFAGASKDSSIIKLLNATNSDMFQNSGAVQTELADLTLDGNKANQTSGGNAVSFSGDHKAVLRNMRIINPYNRGVYLFNCNDAAVLAVEVEGSGKNVTSDGTGISIAVYGNRIRVIGARVDSPNDSGIATVNGPSDIVLVLGSTVHNPSFIGIGGGSPQGATGTSRLVVAVNGVDGSVNSHGIDLGGAVDSIVGLNALNLNYGGFSSDSGARQLWVGNSVRASTGVVAASGFGLLGVGSGAFAYSYLINTDYVVAVNQFTQHQQHGAGFDSVRGNGLIAINLLKNNGQLAGGSAAIRLLGSGGSRPTGNWLVLGNIGYDDQNVKTQTYGLEVGSLVYHVYAIHNDFRGNKNGAILDSGLATYTHGNLGYNPRGFLTAPAPAASGVILYNPFNCDCIVYINGTGAAALTAIAIGGIAAPVNATHVASTTGGTLATATYYYRVSALNPQGETLASAETSIAVVGPTGSVIVKWTAVPGATGYNVYGRSTGAELKMASNVQATAWLDDGSVTPAGALPGGDTTGNTVLTGVGAAPAANSLLVVHVPWGNGIKVTYTTFATANWQWQNAA